MGNLFGANCLCPQVIQLDTSDLSTLIEQRSCLKETRGCGNAQDDSEQLRGTQQVSSEIILTENSVESDQGKKSEEVDQGCLDSNGGKYTGDRVDGKAHGRGIYVGADGSRYSGDWRNDKKHGFGREVWPDGAFFEGCVRNGNMSGPGKFVWKDGSTYEGQFHENNFHGEGIYTWNDGRKYRGQWLRNEMHGSGQFVWVDGRRYDGAYASDEKHGYGILEWPDGRKFKGQWVNGKQHGTGEFITGRGESLQGEWENGRQVKWLDDSDCPALGTQQAKADKIQKSETGEDGIGIENAIDESQKIRAESELDDQGEAHKINARRIP